MAKEEIITAEFVGQRLDNYLFRLYRRIPKSRVYKMLKKGEVRVNGSRKKQDYRVQEGDKLRLPPDTVVGAPAEQKPEEVPKSWQERLENAVIFEDENLLVLDKPAGLAVHSGSGIKYGVIEVFRASRPNTPFMELAHRLDRETSGCLLIAKSRPMLMELHTLLRDGGIDKIYRVLVKGQWKGGERRVDNQLVRSGSRGQIRHTEESDEGKDAVSDFRPLERYDDATLMEVQIYTGRTHQIRVQAEGLDHPVLGDDKYGDFPLNREWKKRGLKRLFLHCYEMSFQLPTSGQKLSFQAPLATELQNVVDQLK